MCVCEKRAQLPLNLAPFPNLLWPISFLIAAAVALMRLYFPTFIVVRQYYFRLLTKKVSIVSANDAKTTIYSITSNVLESLAIFFSVRIDKGLLPANVKAIGNLLPSWE